MAANGRWVLDWATVYRHRAVDVARTDQAARITWRDAGGPIIQGEPKRTGFGSHLLMMPEL
jgi:hypothetical protein